MSRYIHFWCIIIILGFTKAKQNDSPSQPDLQGMRDQIAALEDKVQSLQKANNVLDKKPPKKEDPVGFNVGLTRSQSSKGAIQFNAIIDHYGNCWDSDAYSFVAPITGLYSFHLTIMNARSGLTTMAQLMHESNVLQQAWSDGHGAHNVAVAAAVVKVTTGERVYVVLERGIAHSNQDRWTNFVGHLIQSMKK